MTAYRAGQIAAWALVTLGALTLATLAVLAALWVAGAVT